MLVSLVSFLSWLGGRELQTPGDYMLMESTGPFRTFLAELRLDPCSAPKLKLLPPQAGNQS